MTAEQEQAAAEIRAAYPKTLGVVAVNHALEINKTAKKMLQNFVKIHAKESILMDQILKLPPDAKLRDTAAEETKFKRNINEYKARATAKATAAANEEKARLQALQVTAASAAVKFFSNINHTGFDEDDDDDEEGDMVVVTAPQSAGLTSHHSSRPQTSDHAAMAFDIDQALQLTTTATATRTFDIAGIDTILPNSGGGHGDADSLGSSILPVPNNDIRLAPEFVNAGKYKTYNPSSWREEMIRKKALALENLNRFVRLDTHDNRRVLETFYVVPEPHKHTIVADNAKHHAAPTHHHNLAASISSPQHINIQQNDPHAAEKIHQESHNLDVIVGGVEALLRKFQHDELHLNKIVSKTDSIIQTFDTPVDFLELIKQTEFPKRKQHLENYTWKTRSMKLTLNAKDVRDAAKKEVDEEAMRMSKPRTSSAGTRLPKLHLDMSFDNPDAHSATNPNSATKPQTPHSPSPFPVSPVRSTMINSASRGTMISPSHGERRPTVAHGTSSPTMLSSRDPGNSSSNHAFFNESGAPVERAAR
eukprot:gene30950-38250_t